MPGKTDPRYSSEWTDMGAEPIWVTNSKAGGGRRSGSVYWPCSENKIKGHVPEEIKKEKPGNKTDDVSYNQRIDFALDWLASESDAHVNFAAVYTHGVDGISHKFGPDSQEMLDQIVFCDATVGHLLSQMKVKNLEGELNVIITADHGHSSIYPQQMINIDELLDPSWYHTYPDVSKHARLMLNLWPKEGYHEKVVNALKGEHLNLHVEIKGESKVLEALHYSHNRRIAPVVLYAEPGWVIGRTNATFKFGKGEHGWDPRYDPFMYPIFLAIGPAFKTGLYNAAPFHIVDIYPLMCHLLGLDPAPNNGSLSHTKHILALEERVEEFSTTHVGDDGSFSHTARMPTVEKKTSAFSVIGVAIGVLVVILGGAFIIVLVGRVRKARNVASGYKLVFTKEGSAENLVEDGKVLLSDEELP